MPDAFDVIVIGGGHAGAEAAWAAARLGARTALVTMSSEAIGRMSCNPAIGGIGKGQMVREIDALGGLMGLAADAAGIQFRMLNRSKGPAVWSPRAQADRDRYPQEVQALLGTCRNLQVLEGLVEDLVVDPPPAPETAGGRVVGVTLHGGRELRSPTVVITTGTFLRGLMHCGERRVAGGRVGEGNATGLSRRLLELGFELGRLKTGTPPRVARDSIDFSRLEVQHGDEHPVPFSFMTTSLPQHQIPCWVCYTSPECHELIRGNLHRAPMYSGQISATGVRYCPSIEDKVVRFADKSRHQIFLEPEGYDSDWIYCNGLGTSLPEDVQGELLHRIEGLERARVVQWGYAVEYDWVPTQQIRYSLETRRIEGLFLAGQINGTSGYEEAAAQGLVAGVNAARKIANLPPLILRRDQAYIGVMIDDLITRPPTEPYRMFTSRAEYRLLLRCDNADERLTPIGRDIGLVGEQRWQQHQRKMRHIAALETLLAGRQHHGKRLYDWLRMPDVTWSHVVEHLPPSAAQPPAAVREQVMIRAKYAGYVERMRREIQRLHSLENCRIPEDLLVGDIAGLRHEARERFQAVRPMTIGQASRIGGITPADITVLWLATEAHHRAKKRGTG